MQTYVLNNIEYGFSHVAFDKLVKSSCDRVGEAMTALARQCNFSVPAIKDWRFGKSAPSDIVKVDSIAEYFGVTRDVLLLKIGQEERKMNKLAGEYAEAFAEVYNEIVKFFEAADRAEKFIWKEYCLDSFAPSIVEDIIPSAAWQGDPSLVCKMSCGERGIYAYDLHQQLVMRAERVLERQCVWLGRTSAYEELDEFIIKYLDGYAYREIDGEEHWTPDPESLFPNEPGEMTPLSYMCVVEAEAAKCLDELTRRYLG